MPETIREGLNMRIARSQFMGTCILADPERIALIITFPENGIGYSLVDVTLKDGILVEQVVVSNGCVVCFYDHMRQFTEDEIAYVTAASC